MATFKTVLGPHAAVAAIKSGELRLKSDELEFTDFKETHHAFKPMVDRQAFDICEMAITTLILAKSYGRPLHLLPAVMIGRLQQPVASVNSRLNMASPGDLRGKRIGVRSFAQTTVTWQRGILKCDYDADFDGVEWIKFEDGHVPEAPDPATQAPEGRKMAEMLKAGDIDVALGLKADGDGTVPLFSDDPEGQAWHKRHGCFAINHVIAVPETMVRDHLDAIAEFYALLRANKSLAEPEPLADDPRPMGFEANRASLELLIRYMNELDMLRVRMTPDDLIDPRIREVIGE